MKKHKNQNIQALRGICALMVFLSHALSVKDIPYVRCLMESPLHLLFDGQIAVVVFFTLSGYYYYKESLLTYKSYSNGIQKKITKIYPPHICLLLIGWGILTLYNKYGIHSVNVTEWFSQFWQKDVNVKELLSNVLVVVPHDFNAINPPTWYLIYEVRMIFLFPLFVYLCNRTSWAFAWVLFLISFFIDFLFIKYIEIFVAGSLLHKYINRKNCSEKRINRTILFILLLFAVLFLNIRNCLHSICIKEGILMIIQIIGSLMVVYVFNTRTITRMPKFLCFLGEISYEFYISHFVIMLILTPWIEGALVLIITSLCMSLLVSFFMHKYFVFQWK